MPTIRLNYTYIRTSLMAALLFLMSCLDTIDLEIPKGFDDALVIQGALVKGKPSVVNVSVTRLFDFTPESLMRVNVREVFLSDEAGNTVEIERTGTGTYRLEFREGDAMAIEDNKSYKVSVLTFDGRQYESSLETLLPVPPASSLLLDPIEKELVFSDGRTAAVDSFARLSITTSTAVSDTGQPLALKWDLRRVFKITDTPFQSGIEQKTCYIIEDIDVPTVRVFDGKSISGSRLEEYVLYDQRFNYYLAEGMYFEVIQSSLTDGAYDYWRQISEVSEREGNMFEPPVGKIVTNFNNINDPDEEVFGYFYATSTDTARLYVAPSFADFPQAYCPPPMLITQDGRCAEPLCCDCLSIDRSTASRPEFWVE